MCVFAHLGRDKQLSYPAYQRHKTKHSLALACQGLWNFIVFQVKFNRLNIAPKLTSCKDFLTPKTFRVSTNKKSAYFYLSFKIMIMKVVHLNRYSTIEIISWKIKCLQGIKKILWVCSFGYKNLWNFNWLPMKFQNCLHANSAVL